MSHLQFEVLSNIGKKYGEKIYFLQLKAVKIVAFTQLSKVKNAQATFLALV